VEKSEVDDLRNFAWNERDVFGRRIFEKYEDIDTDFMLAVDDFVTLVKDNYGWKAGRFIVHDINQGAHTLGSLHYKGLAIDGHFDGLTLAQMGLMAVDLGWYGIGLYPEWNQPGIHIDDRKEIAVRWVRKDGGYIYSWQVFEQVITGGE
jgi:hypothetical protein